VGGTDTLRVTSDVPSSDILATMHYKASDHRYAIRTGPDGGAYLTFSIGRPVVGHAVDVTVVVGSGSCSTTFVPE
jgi:hypothetical protein